MTPPPQPAAAAQPTAAALRGAPPIEAQAAARGTLWIAPSVVLLTAFLFAYAAVAVFEIRAITGLLAGYVAWALATVILAFTLPPRPQVPLESPIAKAMLAFVGALIFTTALIYVSGIRSDTDKFLPQVLAVLLMPLPFFLMHSAAARTDAASAVLLSCHVVTALSVVSVVGDFTGATSYETAGGRYFGFLGDGVAWALTFPLLVYFCNKRLVLAAVCVITLGLTGSRAPALCVAAALALLVAVSRGRRLQYIVLLGFIAIVAAYQSDAFVTLLQRLSGTEFTANDRVSNAALGLRIFEQSPLFGSGYNAQGYFYPQTERRVALGQFANQTSPFVQMLVEGGLMLFAAYMAFVIAATIGGIALLKRTHGGATYGIMSGAIVWLLSMLWVNQSALWFMVGSYLGPLVFGVAGAVSGYYARLRFARRQSLAMPAGGL